MTVIAIDIGGSGSRILATDGDEARASGPALVVSGDRADHASVVGALAQALGPLASPVSTVAIGAAGLVSLGDPATLAAAVFASWPADRVIIASDAYAAAVGAWGASGGGIVAAGTGVVGFGTDLRGAWVRADGWGHLVGDAGGAAWIGARGLDAALRQLDGRPGGSAGLLAALRDWRGEPSGLPAAIRAAANPATFLAAFAPEVTRLAEDGDTLASGIVKDAVGHLADTGISVLAPGVPPRLALVGGLADPRGPVARGFIARLRELRPDLELAVSPGAPLDGALALARQVGDGPLQVNRAPYVSIHQP